MRTRTIAFVLVITVAALLTAPPVASAQSHRYHRGPSAAAVVTGVILGGLFGYLAVQSGPWDERYHPSYPPPPVYGPYPPCMSCGAYPTYPVYEPLPTRPLPSPGPYPSTTSDPAAGYPPTASGSYGPPPSASYPPPAAGPGSTQSDQADSRIPDAASWAGSGSGTLSVRVQPLDADIVVDGELWNRAPGQERLALTLAAGPHHIDVRKPGCTPFGTDVTVKAGDTLALNVSLSAR